MKYFIIILLSFLFASCNPFISKDLRRKNKCNRKLERVVRKCPELLKMDTTIAIYDTTIITQGSKVDTIVSIDFDTITLFKDKLRLKLIRTRDTLLIDGECIPDTIRIKEFIKVPYDSVSTIELSTSEKIINFLSRFWWWGIVIVLVFLIGRAIKKYFL